MGTSSSCPIFYTIHNTVDYDRPANSLQYGSSDRIECKHCLATGVDSLEECSIRGGNFTISDQEVDAKLKKLKNEITRN